MAAQAALIPDMVTAITLCYMGIVLGWWACKRILKNHLLAAAVMLPLFLKIPWFKLPPSIDDSLTILAIFLVLAGWLYARSWNGGSERAGFCIVLAAVLLKPHILLLPLFAVLVDGLVLHRPKEPLKTFKGVLAVLAAACASVLAWKFAYSPAIAMSWLVGMIKSGTAWDSGVWIFAGDGGRAYNLAATNSLYFYWPLIPPFIFLALKFRRERWIGPLVSWAAIITGLTLVHVSEPNIHSCLAMTAALTVGFGVPGAAALGKHLRNRGATASGNGLRTAGND